MNGVSSQSLPIYALGPTLLIYAAFVLYIAQRSRSLPGAFVLVAIAIRLSMSAAPTFSFTSSPVGLSWNALVSCMVIGCGGLVVQRGRMLSYALPPILLLACWIAISGAINGRITESIETLVKYGYFATLMLTIYDACKAEGYGSFIGKLIFVFSLPLLLQFESVALGVVKAGESDGSASYIGGYNHEAAFSVVLMAAFLTVAINTRLSVQLQFLAAAVCVAGVILANYRTAIGAMVPIIVALIVVSVMRKVVQIQRAFALLVGSLIVMCTVPLVLALFADRFDTLTQLIQNPGLPFSDPDRFTFDEQRILSGRAFIWAEYFDLWRKGSPLQIIAGFGPDAWEQYFSHYAHNTLVSTVFEYGLVGLVLMIVLWIWMIIIASRAPQPLNLLLVASHLGFFLLNMATMPFWMIEGLIYYGILCGVGLFALEKSQAARDRKVTSPTPLDMASTSVQP